MSKEEKYIEIKKRDIIIAVICIFYLVFAVVCNANQDSDTLTNMCTAVYFVSFPMFSVFMGCYITSKTKMVVLPTALWLIYCFLIGMILVKEMYFTSIMLIMSFLWILLFFVSGLITKVISLTKKDEQDKQ